MNISPQALRGLPISKAIDGYAGVRVAHCLFDAHLGQYVLSRQSCSFERRWSAEAADVDIVGLAMLNTARTKSMLDRRRLMQAFDLLGRDLVERQLFIELAVYGGSAIMLQFEWRRTTEDVDAVVREGYDEAAILPSVARVAREMTLDEDWLNNAVGMFTPLDEDDDLFEIAGSYPADGQPGLRVLVATPRYLLAMKLNALQNIDRGERDMVDAQFLASHLGVATEPELFELYVSIHDEEPSIEASSRFSQVLKGP